MQIRKDQIPVPEKLDEVVEKKLDILYREQKVKRIRRSVIGVGSAAACVMGVVAVGVANPAWAAGLPIVGHIFEQMQENFDYPGDYSQVGTALTEDTEEPASGETADGETTADGIDGAAEAASQEIQIVEGTSKDDAESATDGTSVDGVGSTADGTSANGTGSAVDGASANGTGTAVDGASGDGTGSVVDEASAEGTAENAASASGDLKYTKVVDGVTVTLSEVYCNGQSLNITLAITSGEPFPDTMIDQFGNVVLACRTEETYSFNPAKQSDLIYLEGDFVDEYTFAGLMRIDLNGKNTDNSALSAAYEEAGEDEQALEAINENYENYVKKVEIPETFSMKLDIAQIFGYLAEPDIREFELSAEEQLVLSEEEWQAYMREEDEKDPSWNTFPNEHENYWFDGTWSFELEVNQNDSQCTTVEIGTVNEDGAGMEKLEITPFEITMYPTCPSDGTTYYFPVILDADGMLMSTGGGGRVETVAIADHDISTLEVYLFDDTLWLDEIKGYWWKTADGLQKGELLEDGRTFKELCDETCEYHETVEVSAEE